MACEPNDHHFVQGGKGEGEWEAWLFCDKCGAIGMVPIEATKPMTVILPRVVSEGEEGAPSTAR
jgi:hypothetical protein